MAVKNLVLSGLENNKNFNFKENYVIFGDWMSGDPAELSDDMLVYYKFQEESHVDLKSQHEYISQIYQAILKKLAAVLNDYHSESMSVRQWEIIIGHWLKIYLDSLYVRWKLVKVSFKEDWEKVYVLDEDIDLSIQVPKSRNDFVSLVSKSLHWNQLILSEIANKYLSNDHLKFIPTRQDESKMKGRCVQKKINLKFIITNFLKKYVKLLITKTSCIFSTATTTSSTNTTQSSHNTSKFAIVWGFTARSMS